MTEELDNLLLDLEKKIEHVLDCCITLDETQKASVLSIAICKIAINNGISQQDFLAIMGFTYLATHVIHPVD